MSTISTELPSVSIEAAMQQTPPKLEPKLVIFAWSGELDKIWPTLILATTSAAMGQETTVFFTFWGLFPLVKNDVRITGENWMQKMLSMMNRGGIDHLKLSKSHKVASPAELLALAKEMGVKLIPCQMTMDMLGLKREDLIDGLEEPAGATTALLAAQGASTLFI